MRDCTSTLMKSVSRKSKLTDLLVRVTWVVVRPTEAS